MAESVILDASPRTGRGSRASRGMRKKGQVPAVVCGHKEATVAVTLSKEELVKAIRRGARVVDLKTGGALQKAFIREIQWDFLGKEILHVDFARVAADERIKVTVPIEIRGTAAGVTAGGVLDQPLHMLQIECLAVSIPESIRVNVSELQMDGAIHVRELHLPPDVKALDDPEALVVHVVAKQVEVEIVAEPVVGESAEPEVITKKAVVEEEAE